jgi:alpha-L-arabinofuranosidase
VLSEGALALFAVNRGDAPLALDASLRELDGVGVYEHVVLADEDLTAANTAESPERVTPSRAHGAHVENGRLTAELPARSWNVLRLTGGTLGSGA